MRRKPRKKDDEDNGFAAWGGYMEAKKAKLSEQYNIQTSKQTEQKSDIFHGVAILVNGYTKPGADELKLLMASHGGSYHLYQNQGGCPTTHIIASNLPNVKINQLGNTPIVSPEWITKSIEANKLLDCTKFLLYTNHSRTQPKLNFAVVEKDKTQLSTPGNQKPVEQQTKYAKTAADPEFLSEFYSNSRLHLISTLGAEFKQMVNRLRDESKGGKFPGLDRLNLIKHSLSTITEYPLRSDSIIMHIDMDCFFVSVGLRNRPDLRGKPVAVTHSKTGRSHTRGASRQAEVDLYASRLPEGAVPKVNLIDETSSMAEIASCSYEARKCGIHNGMFMGSALKLCPDLIPIPYDFQDYKDVSSILYRTIAEYTVDIEAVSCDEMYVDVTKVLKQTGLTIDEWATHIRREIMERTGCPCSTGFGANKLQARIATKKAKPNGQYYLGPENVENYMYELPLEELPGVGYATKIKLHNLGLKTCGDIYDISIQTLKKELGQKTAEIICNQSKGMDHRPLNFEHERKSVSADVNYGIRFKSHTEALTFLESLSKEVNSRLSELQMRAKTITLKLLVRAADAPKETAKYLGCGVCDAINKSVTTNYYIDNEQAIFKEAKSLYDRLKVDPEELRGVGIQLSKLEKMMKSNKALANFLNQNNQGNKSTETITKDNNGNIPDDVLNNANVDKITDDYKNITNDNTNIDNQVTSAVPIVIKSVPDKITATSKRGKSGKGVNNATNKANTNLTNYFKNTKTDATTVKEVKNNNVIDLNILKELPIELQKEIIKEYNLPNTAIENPEGAPKPNTASTKDKQESKQPTKQISRKKGFADLTKEELKTLLKNWINNEETPKDVDVDMLGSFFTSLVHDRRIDYLFSIVSLLYRHISKKGCKWHDAYYRLLNQFQETMLLTYGNPLLVPNGFSCGNHN